MDTFWVERRERLAKELGAPNWWRRTRCRIGWHYWWSVYQWVDRKGYGKCRWCPYCRKDGGLVCSED